ncbi:unnamed protein product [Meganyctiphanes norvegica]|uniref:Glycogen [starch] synthase n=1 Tax=Meganyctiphanes norvegica TaxID=48144 RepID=A0AAV2QG00_MEGNR
MSQERQCYPDIDALSRVCYVELRRGAAAQSCWRFLVFHRYKTPHSYEVIAEFYISLVSKTGYDYIFGSYKEHNANTKSEIPDFQHSESIHKWSSPFRKYIATVYSGRWLVEGNPQIILFDIGSAAGSLHDYKCELYNNTKIGIPHPDVECNDAVIFGFMVAEFITQFRNILESESECKPHVIAHFHEWLTGIGLIQLRMKNVDVATVFTTHATLLGRFLCAGAVDFYNNLDKVNIDEEAGKRGIYHRYCMERCAVHLAHTFTTVSEITGVESNHLLQRIPDIITPNGLNVKKFAAIHEFQNLHATAKEKINDFVRGHFYGHLDFDLNETLYFFIAGRYEFGNKGADIYIEALARLNHYMKASGSKKTIVAFMIFPAKTNNFNIESLRGQAITKSLRDTIHEIQVKIGKRMYDTCLAGDLPDPDDLLLKEETVRLKRCIYASHRSTLPPITTHNIVNDDKDPVLNALRRCCLFNDKNDRVKVVFHPEFLSATNPLFGMDYEEFVRGCHLGVFPSYYEPWGYTPAECTVMGIPSVTTNLSGFGCFMAEHIADPMSYGIYIVDRRWIGLEESVRQLAQYLYDFVGLNRRQRIIQRNRTERLSDLLDWRILGTYYRQARSHALHKVFPEILEDEDQRGAGRLNYPRPLSEPPSPSSSRHTTPAPSDFGSDDEDSVDSEAELQELNASSNNDSSTNGANR